MKQRLFSMTSLFDKLGISATTICFIHCLIFPLLFPLLTTIGLGYLFHKDIELIFFIISFVIAFFSLSVGFFKYHRNWQPYFLFLLASAIFIFRFFFSSHQHCHECHGSFEHFFFIFSISGFIIASHIINTKLCKKCQCCKSSKQ